MRHHDTLYLNGQLIPAQGSQWLDLIDPTTETISARVRLASTEDAERAVAAARRAQPAFAATSKAERMALLHRLHDAVLARREQLCEATMREYGGPQARSMWVADYAASTFLDAARVLENFAFERHESDSLVLLEPVGVSLLITPWNSSAGSVCSKLAMALAAGCTTVIKPSELSAWQTEVLVEAFSAAGVPPGVVNVINGGGDVGALLCGHPNIARISFTGSGRTGRAVAQQALGTMKRVTLGLDGKSPTLLLEDADFATAIPAALQVAFQNSGQACIAGSRLLVPQARLAEACEQISARIKALRVGDPADPDTEIGPMATRAQYERIQGYIAHGLGEGARLLAGGLGRPQGLKQGFFVRPTAFLANNHLRIAREEIFGPVLCVIPYRDEEDAITIANDSVYGLHAYVHSANAEHAMAVARRLQAGRVAINGFRHDPLAPFGGYKQSGLGREFGEAGLASFLEVKAVLEAKG